MNIYQAQELPIPGTNYKEIYKRAISIYRQICRKTKRRPYIRSAYFNKSKIFLGLFWQHLEDKFNNADKARRLKYFTCALELIQHSKGHPTSKENVDRRSEILHRFMGKTKNSITFYIQIKEDKRSGEKFLISIFPV